MLLVFINEVLPSWE